MLLLALLLAAAPDAGVPPTGPLPSAFARAVFSAEAIVEFEVPIAGDAKKKSVRLWAEGLAKAKPVRVVASRAGLETPPEATARPWEILSSCFHRAREKGESVKVLLVYSGGAYGLMPLATMGFAMSSTPGYAQLIEALAEASQWREERMRAVGAEQLWAAQRAALGSDNAYLRHLASEWLVQHEASALVDAAWGADGTPERSAKMHIAPTCAPP